MDRDTDSHHSQFISISEYGVILCWITVDVYNTNTNNNQVTSTTGTGTQTSEWKSILSVDDYGLSPWSTVKLTVNRQIMSPVGGSIWNNVLITVCPGESTTTFLYCHDTTSSVLQDEVHHIHKLVRHGEPSTPTYYTQLNHTVTVSGNPSDIFNTTSLSTTVPRVTCMDIIQGTSTSTSYLLAGRENGTVDLYEMSVNIPILSWKPCDFVSLTKGSGNASDSPVIMVKWVSHTSFLVIDNIGVVYYFDLQITTDQPVLIDNSITNMTGNKRPITYTSNMVDISSNYYHLNQPPRIHVLITHDYKVYTYKLHEKIGVSTISTITNPSNNENNDTLIQLLSSRISITHPTVQILYNNTSSNSNNNRK